MRYLYWFCFCAAGLALSCLIALYARPVQARPAGTPLDTPTATVTDTPTTPSTCGVSFGGSTPSCQGDSYTAYFGFYNSCPLTFTGATTIVFQVSTSFSGPWTDFDSYSYTQPFPSGASNASHNFSESSIPGQYVAFRFHYTSQVDNGQLLDRYSQVVALCNQGTVTPTPTGITTRCYVQSTGEQSSCTLPGDYGYDFGVYIACGTSLPGNGSIYFQVAADPGGPWTTYDQQSFNGTYPPGAYSFQGTFSEPNIPAPAAWYQITFTAMFAGNHSVSDQTAPAPLCGTGGATATPTMTPHVPTATATGYSCFDMRGSGVPIPCTATPTPSASPPEPSATPPPPDPTPWSPTNTATPPALNATATATGYSCGGTGGAEVPIPCSSTPTARPSSPTATATFSPGQHFSDVHPSDYFYIPVEYLFAHGVISGYADGTFRPYSPTTRAQMVKIVVLGFALPLATPAPGNYTFADMPPAQPFFAVVETAAAHNIVSGYTCGGPGEPCDQEHRPYFRPNANVTRGQLSKIVVGAAGWPVLNPATPTFADVPPGSPFYPFVETAVCHGVISGYADHTFRPGANATRGQIAKIVYGALTADGACQ